MYIDKSNQTKTHSSRIHTALLPTVHDSVAKPPDVSIGRGVGGNQVKNFE